MATANTPSLNASIRPLPTRGYPAVVDAVADPDVVVDEDDPGRVVAEPVDDPGRVVVDAEDVPPDSEVAWAIRLCASWMCCS